MPKIPEISGVQKDNIRFDAALDNTHAAELGRVRLLTQMSRGGVVIPGHMLDQAEMGVRRSVVDLNFVEKIKRKE